MDFLNTLGRTQQDTRTGTDLASGITSVTNRYVMRNGTSMSYRTGIRCDATIPATGTITFIAILTVMGRVETLPTDRILPATTLSWADGAAYADWGIAANDRMEFEKACRGTAAAVADEYAWGVRMLPRRRVLRIAARAARRRAMAGRTAPSDFHASVQGPMRVGFCDLKQHT